MTKHLDEKTIVDRRLVLKYNSKNPPDDATKRSLSNAVRIASRIMRKVVWEIDKIVLFYRDESALMTSILDTHFNMSGDPNLASTRDAKGKLVNQKARRALLGQVRWKMLANSFHLTQPLLYVLDIDTEFRTTVSGQAVSTLSAVWQDPDAGRQAKGLISKDIQGYAKRGETLRIAAPLHINFDLCKISDGYVAMVIIHEGSHAWGNTIDHAYINQAHYRTSIPDKLSKNADSHAFVAMSLSAGKLLDSDADVIAEIFD